MGRRSRERRHRSRECRAVRCCRRRQPVRCRQSWLVLYASPQIPAL